jgi:tRNA (cytidine/uridine-2'-O-)-methyltransferase
MARTKPAAQKATAVSGLPAERENITPGCARMRVAPRMRVANIRVRQIDHPTPLPPARLRPVTRGRGYTVEEAELCDRLPHNWAQKSAVDGSILSARGELKTEAEVRLALFEPDIPQNTAALLRLAACFGVAIDLIEPCGFLLDDRRFKRAALDYAALCRVARHASWNAFLAARQPGSRLVLMTTSGAMPLHHFAFADDDTILLGRESAGVPPAVHGAADARLVIPLRPPARSLNVALAGALALGEALRQTGLLPTT